MLGTVGEFIIVHTHTNTRCGNQHVGNCQTSESIKFRLRRSSHFSSSSLHDLHRFPLSLNDDHCNECVIIVIIQNVLISTKLFLLFPHTESEWKVTVHHFNPIKYHLCVCVCHSPTSSSLYLSLVCVLLIKYGRSWYMSINHPFRSAWQATLLPSTTNDDDNDNDKD